MAVPSKGVVPSVCAGQRTQPVRLSPDQPVFGCAVLVPGSPLNVADTTRVSQALTDRPSRFAASSTRFFRLSGTRQVIRAVGAPSGPGGALRGAGRAARAG